MAAFAIAVLPAEAAAHDQAEVPYATARPGGDQLRKVLLVIPFELMVKFSLCFPRSSVERVGFDRPPLGNSALGALQRYYLHENPQNWVLRMNSQQNS